MTGLSAWVRSGSWLVDVLTSHGQVHPRVSDGPDARGRDVNHLDPAPGETPAGSAGGTN